MVDKLIVDLKERSYPICFADDFSQLPDMLKERKLSTKILVVTDSNVDKYHGDDLVKTLESAGFTVGKSVFEAGEKNKNLQTIAKIYDDCLKYKLDRKSVIIALGGGVTGDMAGFAAATYMRGVNFVQVPTSLLAQVDSSVGGKVGIDFGGSKNIVGAFYQPQLVYMNMSCLKTLPIREFTSGMGEVIKHGIIYDANFFEDIEQNLEKIFGLDTDKLKEIVKKNCSIKAAVVQEDETEQDLRAILNFGHTIGHAIESVCEFSLLHGECVALGMVAVSQIAVKQGLINQDVMERIEKLIKKANLPIRISLLNKEKVYEEMFRDKKMTENKLKFVLPTEIGRVIQTTEVSKDQIFEAMDYIKE